MWIKKNVGKRTASHSIATRIKHIHNILPDWVFMLHFHYFNSKIILANRHVYIYTSNDQIPWCNNFFFYKLPSFTLKTKIMRIFGKKRYYLRSNPFVNVKFKFISNESWMFIQCGLLCSCTENNWGKTIMITCWRFWTNLEISKRSAAFSSEILCSMVYQSQNH